MVCSRGNFPQPYQASPPDNCLSIGELVWPFFLPVVAVVAGIIHVKAKDLHGPQAIGPFFMRQIVIGLGFGCVYAAMGRLFAADRVAASIGWPAGSPFQRKVGMWDASMQIIDPVPEDPRHRFLDGHDPWYGIVLCRRGSGACL
ncbi:MULTISPECIES: DUF6790 family protein [unclassified Methanoregula]|uniref:DUF6790 family protein n=1 Tax=unclassified Methanoregula TaxID=2649730 RepID=UPI0025F925BC|nr:MULTISPECIES: DUF6790 family protein [unclassified Methanoregula]